MEAAEIQASLQSPLFSRLVEDGEYLFEVFESPVTLHFFSTLCAETLSPPPTLYFEPKPILSKTLKGLLMRPVIFENTIFHAVKFTEYYSIRLLRTRVKGEWKGKEPSVFVCLFLCSTLLNISSSRSIWFRRVSVLSGV